MVDDVVSRLVVVHFVVQSKCWKKNSVMTLLWFQIKIGHLARSPRLQRASLLLPALILITLMLTIIPMLIDYDDLLIMPLAMCIAYVNYDTSPS